MTLIGWVDSCSAAGIEGWASDTTRPEQPAEVDIYLGSRRVDRIRADRHRADLQAAGHGDGCKAFFYHLSHSLLEAAGESDVQVCFAGTRQLLANGSFRLSRPVGESNPFNAAAPYDYSTLWLGAALCQQHINRTISGDAEVSPTTYFLRKYVLPRGDRLAGCRALLLGANEGHLERELRRLGFSGEIVATDIADNALERARSRSAALGDDRVRYVVHDLNEPPGDKFGGPFDFILAEGVLHHIRNIGPCLEACRRLLRDDGYLFALEFEGPFRFQLSDLQTRWINAALNVLPRGLRPFPDQPDAHYPATEEDNRRIHYVVASEESVARMDPSEALVGPQLKRMIPELFDVEERKGFGGTLLSYMTCHFDFKRTATDPYAARWLRVLMEIERALIDTGILEDEYVFYVLRKKKRKSPVAAALSGG
jgi:SAM-dependent methyltransferase